MARKALELSSGYGDGYSDGSGDGYGSGSGYGSGYGDGSGYGSGYGDKKTITYYFSSILKSFRKQKSERLMFWKSNIDGKPTNGGHGEAVKIGLIQKVTGPLQLCTHRALHGTLDPRAWRGERWWVVGLREPVVSQDDKYGSLQRRIIADLGKCPF